MKLINKTIRVNEGVLERLRGEMALFTQGVPVMTHSGDKNI